MEPTSPTPSEELYRFGADGNLRLYSYDRLFFALYGYDGGTTRTYKYSFDLNPNWVNGRLESVNFNLHNAMFYPNSYINFNSNGYYTKHYYNGMERIASRLGDQNLPISTHDPELQDRKEWQDSLIRKNIVEITGYEFLEPGQEQDPDDPKPIFELPQVVMTALQPIGSGDIYYYHGNHLGSTAFVTDQTQTIVQGFLYAPFGEITNEHNSSFGNGVMPKYSFNAKELDEETGMYYYEARYYQPPVFVSRDRLFEKYPFMSPYSYCLNNPIKYIDPSGDSVDVSRLSNSALEQYTAGIQELQKSPLFSAYYNALQKSPNIYYIEEGVGKGGSGSYESNRSVVSAVLDNLYVLSQELFHAFQSDCNFYTSKDASVREAEGDIAAQLVMYDLARGSIAEAWSSQLFNYVDDYARILTPQFSKEFSNMVDLRIDFYKQRELQDGAIAPKGYIQANSGKPPLALQEAIKLINSQKR